MQINVTDNQFGVILEPLEASRLLDRLNGIQTSSIAAETIAPLHEALADFVFGPDDDNA